MVKQGFVQAQITAAGWPIPVPVGISTRLGFEGTKKPIRAFFRRVAGMVFIALLVSTTQAGDDLNDVLFGDSFEGFALLGGTISGRAFDDPDQDGLLLPGDERPGITVYLDTNYNGRLDDGERTTLTDNDGFYEFNAVGAGLYHVRQQLAPANVQTVPAPGVTPDYDFLPDEVVEYQHAPPGVGNFDQPYGKNASPWPGEWADLAFGSLPELVDSIDLVLEPIGVRNRLVAGRVSKGNSALTLPEGARILLRFDEPIIDGPGTDLVIHSLVAGPGSEAADVFGGPAADQLTRLGNVETQISGGQPLDLADAGYDLPVHYLELVSTGNGGTWFGFELVGVEVLNIAPALPGAHIVTMSAADPTHENLDFGRYFDDLPPTLTLSVGDGEPGTTGLRAGETAEVQLNAVDDLGLDSVTLSANGQPVPLDADLAASIALTHPGELVLEASASDKGGQTILRELTAYVLNADGTNPLNPNLTGNNQGPADAPSVRILSPAPGTVADVDLDIIASITGNPAPTSWTLEYAPVDQVDPYDLPAANPAYQLLASGSSSVFSEPIGTLPLATLPDGIYFLRLTAQADSGPPAYFGQVVARNVDGAALQPQITIVSPAQESHVPISADIVASIESQRPLIEWFIEYAPASDIDLNNLGAADTDWRRLAEDTAPVPIAEVLANFDASMLPNDRYVLRIVARNDIGLGWVEPLLIDVTGGVKLGRNRLEFTDIEIELAGFPLRLIRVYDSLRANEDGELGYGWSLELASTDIGETVPDTGFGVFGATPFRVGTRVFITAPGGERVGFTFDPQPGTPGPLGLPYRVAFQSDPGNYWQLEVPQGNQAFLTLTGDGTVQLFGTGFPYNPEVYVLIAPDGRRYTVHEDRGMLRAEDPAGNALNFTDSGIAHSSGLQLNFVRDPQGRIREIRDPDGNAWFYNYDANGDLVSTTDPDSLTTTYSYLSDPAHYLDTIIDPQGRQPRRYEYDPDSGRLVAFVDENGVRTEQVYDPAAFTGLTVNGRGNVSLLEYNERGNPTRTEDELGNVSRWQYDDPDNPDRFTRLIDPSGEQWDYSYDAFGRTTRIRTPLAGISGLRYIVEYDTFGNVTRYTRPDGRTDTFDYDESGHRLSENWADGVDAEFEVSPEGRLMARQYAGGYRVDYQYDANGWLSGESDNAGYMQSLIYRPNGRLLQRTDFSGVLDVEFAPGGLLNSQLDANGNRSELIENPDGSLTRTDRNGISSTMELDVDDKPVNLMLPVGGDVTLSYDPDDNIESVTDPLNNTTTMVHDVNNRLIQITDPLGQSTTMTRDANGNVVEIIDRNGKRRTFEWDANRRLRFERWHDSSGIVIREIEFVYFANRLSRVDDTFGGQTHSIDYSGAEPRYSSVRFIYPGQPNWTVDYNWARDLAFPVRIDLVRGVANSQAVITANAFSGNTQRLRWRHPDINTTSNEVQLIRTPDGRIERMRRLTGPDGGDAVSETVISYDALGRPVGLRHEDASGLLLHPNAELSYTLDAEGRLLGQSHAGNSVIFDYDDNGQLISASHSNPAYADEAYSYDLGGNRLNSHLTPTQAGIAVPNRIATSGDYSYTYDLAGNVIERSNSVSSQVVTFAYDHRNRLIEIQVLPSAGATPDHLLEYGYDYKDRTMYRIVNGVRTWFVHDRDQLLAEIDDASSDVSAHYFYDPSAMDFVFAVWRGDERWLLTDRMGSVRGIIDAAFNVLSWVDYDSYGNLQSGSLPALDEPLGYKSRLWIAAAGLYDMRRRFYDPSLGRFTQEDPLGYGGRDYHLYRYANNSPINLRDPTGETVLENTWLLLAETIATMVMAADPQANSDLTLPCEIARWSALTFGYFDPLAELIMDPASAVDSPEIEPVDLYEATGCAKEE